MNHHLLFGACGSLVYKISKFSDVCNFYNANENHPFVWVCLEISDYFPISWTYFIDDPYVYDSWQRSLKVQFAHMIDDIISAYELIYFCHQIDYNT